MSTQVSQHRPTFVTVVAWLVLLGAASAVVNLALLPMLAKDTEGVFSGPFHFVSGVSHLVHVIGGVWCGLGLLRMEHDSRMRTIAFFAVLAGLSLLQLMVVNNDTSAAMAGGAALFNSRDIADMRSATLIGTVLGWAWLGALAFGLSRPAIVSAFGTPTLAADQGSVPAATAQDD